MSPERHGHSPARSTTSHAWPLQVGPFHQHVEHATQQRALILFRQLLLQLAQTGPALCDDSWHNAPRKGDCRCPVTRAVGEDMDLAEARLADDSTGGVEILVRLAGEADYYVRSKGGLNQCLAKPRNSFEEAATAIAAAHGGQDAITAALQAQVQVRADTRRNGHRSNQVVAGLRGLQARESHTEVAMQSIQPVQEVPEALPPMPRLALAPIDPVVAEMDPRKHNLLIACSDEHEHFLCHLLDGPAANDRANAGNDAITAVEQTAVL